MADTTMRVGGVTATMTSTGAKVSTAELDLDDADRIYVTRTDNRCYPPDRLYMVTVTTGGYKSITMEVAPERIVDVLAALSWRKPDLQIVYSPSTGPVD
jgi:hypothetical protein